jgi:hypothetical protein
MENSPYFCKHIAKAAQAQEQAKALSKRLQGQREEINFKNAQPNDKMTGKIAAVNRRSNRGSQEWTAANSMLPPWAVTCKMEAECSYPTFVQVDGDVL